MDNFNRSYFEFQIENGIEPHRTVDDIVLTSAASLYLLAEEDYLRQAKAYEQSGKSPWLYFKKESELVAVLQKTPHKRGGAHDGCTPLILPLPEIESVPKRFYE